MVQTQHRPLEKSAFCRSNAEGREKPKAVSALIDTTTSVLTSMACLTACFRGTLSATVLPFMCSESSTTLIQFLD